MSNPVEQILKAIYDFFDQAYEESWLLIAIAAIIIIFVFIMLN